MAISECSQMLTLSERKWIYIQIFMDIFDICVLNTYIIILYNIPIIIINYLNDILFQIV